MLLWHNCSQGRNQTSQELRQVKMMWRRNPTSLLWKDQKPRNNLQKRLLNMVNEKEFISMRRKSFHYINHSITKGIKGMTTMAWEEMAMVKTEQTCFERDSQIVIVILLQKALLQKMYYFVKINKCSSYILQSSFSNNISMF